MSEEIPSDGDYKPRSALGDVTNQVGKRGFSLISTSGAKSGDGYKKDEGFQFAKKECLRVDNFRKENFHKEITECVLRAHSCSEIKSLKKNMVDSVSKITCEAKESCTSGVRQNATSSITVKSGNAVGESCTSTPMIPTNTSDRLGSDVIIEINEDEKSDSAVVPEIASKEKVENSLGVDDDVAGLENLDLSKDEYLDCSRLPESQESRCGLERCIGQKGDGFSNMCMDLIKACPCSFCMKAAYIWSDLHYQDIKGRIAAIKKSQKEASILVHQNSRDGAIGKYGQGSFEKFSNLESDLTGRWMSLFLHMEDIFVREGSQLERSLSTLKELRDNCKTDSEKQ